VGKWSDTRDRRQVLMVLTLTASVMGFLLFLFAAGPAAVKLVLALAFGAVALPVYWVSVAHANDHAAPGEVVDVSSNLLLVFAASAIAGPIFASIFSAEIGVGGLFLFTAIIHLAIAGLIYMRIRARGPVPMEDRETFMPIPQKSSTAVFDLDPRQEPQGTAANGNHALPSPRDANETR
jgi:MFS family permease